MYTDITNWQKSRNAVSNKAPNDFLLMHFTAFQTSKNEEKISTTFKDFPGSIKPRLCPVIDNSRYIIIQNNTDQPKQIYKFLPKSDSFQFLQSIKFLLQNFFNNFPVFRIAWA